MAARNRIDLLTGSLASPAERLAAHARGLAAADPRVRADSARGLSLMAKTGALPASRAVTLVEPLLGDPDLEVRLASAGALAGIDAVGWAPKLHAALLEALRETDAPDSLRRAASQLVAFGDSGLTTSLRAAAEAIVRDAAGTLRVTTAVLTLGALAGAGDREALRPLIAALSDPSRENQQIAAMMLARIRRPEAADALARWRAASAAAKSEKVKK